jgi:hypothetical protein
MVSKVGLRRGPRRLEAQWDHRVVDIFARMILLAVRHVIDLVGEDDELLGETLPVATENVLLLEVVLETVVVVEVLVLDSGSLANKARVVIL